MNRKRPPEQRPRATGTPSEGAIAGRVRSATGGRVGAVAFGYGYDDHDHDHSGTNSQTIFSALRSFYNSKDIVSPLAFNVAVASDPHHE